MTVKRVIEHLWFVSFFVLSLSLGSNADKWATTSACSLVYRSSCEVQNNDNGCEKNDNGLS